MSIRNKNQQKQQVTYTRAEAEKWLDEHFPEWTRINQGFRWIQTGLYVRLEDDYGARFFGLVL